MGTAIGIASIQKIALRSIICRFEDQKNDDTEILVGVILDLLPEHKRNVDLQIQAFSALHLVLKDQPKNLDNAIKKGCIEQICLMMKHHTAGGALQWGGISLLHVLIDGIREENVIEVIFISMECVTNDQKNISSILLWKILLKDKKFINDFMKLDDNFSRITTIFMEERKNDIILCNLFISLSVILSADNNMKKALDGGILLLTMKTLHKTLNDSLELVCCRIMKMSIMCLGNVHIGYDLEFPTLLLHILRSEASDDVLVCLVETLIIMIKMESYTLMSMEPFSQVISVILKKEKTSIKLVGLCLKTLFCIMRYNPMLLFVQFPEYMQTIHKVMITHEKDPGIRLAGMCVFGKTFQFTLKKEGVKSLESVLSFMSENINDWKRCGLATWTLWMMLQESRENRIQAKQNGGLELMAAIQITQKDNPYFNFIKPIDSVYKQMEQWIFNG
jgi:hypothetical protein